MRLQKAIAEHEEGQATVTTIIKQTLCLDILRQEKETFTNMERLAVQMKLLKRRAVLYSLRVQGAHQRERQLHEARGRDALLSNYCLSDYTVCLQSELLLYSLLTA